MKKNFLILAAACLFFVNPMINIKDHIPDFIGCLLIIIAVSALSKIEDYLGEARKRFIMLCAVTAGKAVIWVTFPQMSDITRLLLAFSFAIAEAVIFLPAFFGLLSGLGYLVSRHGSENCTKDPAGLKTITAVSFFVRQAAAVLPLAPTLSGEGGSVVYGSSESVWSQFTNLYYIFGTIVVLAVSVPWAVKFIKLNVSLAKDEELCGILEKKYESEVLAYPLHMASDRLKTAAGLTVAACAFTLNFYTDHVNMLPNFISAILFAAALLLLREAPAKYRVTGICADAAWAVLAFVSLSLQRNFAAEGYSPEWALHDIGKSAEMYRTIEIFSVIEAAMFCVGAVMFALCIKRSISSYAAEAERLAGEKKRADKVLVFLFIFLFLAVAMNFAQTIIMKYYPAVWIISGLLSAALTFAAYRAYAVITDGMCHKMSV